MKTVESITRDLLNESGVEVTAFRPFEPYQLQTIHLESTTEQRQKRDGIYNAPQFKQAPVDKHEYWDWMQERAQERWQEIKDRNEQREEERKANREEVLRVVEETWGHPPMLSLKALQKYAEEQKELVNNPPKKEDEE